jgi:hypothetical protein
MGWVVETLGDKCQFDVPAAVKGGMLIVVRQRRDVFFSGAQKPSLTFGTYRLVWA